MLILRNLCTKDPIHGLIAYRGGLRDSNVFIMVIVPEHNSFDDHWFNIDWYNNNIQNRLVVVCFCHKLDII